MSLLTLKAQIGGGNQAVVFSLANPTTADTTALFTYNRTESSTRSGYPTRGNRVYDYVSKIENDALHVHLQAYMAGVTPIKEITQDYENGDNSMKREAVTSTDKLILIDYGAIDADAKRKVEVSCSVYTGDTGNSSSAKDTVGGVTIQLSAVENLATITVPSTCLDTSLVTGIGDISIPPNTNAVITYFTAV